MLYDIHRNGKVFPHYKYDSDIHKVCTYHFKKNNGIVITELKWLETGGVKRVTLFERGNAHYFSERQILKMTTEEIQEKESIVINQDGEVLFKGSDNEAKEVAEKYQEMGNIEKFFRERDNKPIRIDAFRIKFGRDVDMTGTEIIQLTSGGSKYVKWMNF